MSSESGDSKASAGGAWKSGTRDRAKSASTGRVIKAGSAGKRSSSKGGSTGANYSYLGDDASTSSRKKSR